MNEIIRKKLEEINRKAKEDGYKAKITLRNRSSLHRIIRTKEQADLFMKMLKSL